MIFNLDRHRIRVASEALLAAAGGGAIAAVMATWADPSHFNVTDLNEWRNLGRVAIGGAFTGVFFLLRTMPRNPALYERRSDPKQVAQAAEKLGMVEDAGQALADVKAKELR